MALVPVGLPTARPGWYHRGGIARSVCWWSGAEEGKMGEEQAPMHSGLTEREAAQWLRVKGFNHMPQSRR
ncbi:protein of unknown function [Kyrpidia spormannii]|uniref:Uncharacterized protein n=2 Tax=Kyrpidia spormannii TaxID=2055160 RepID=A0ACA8ZCB9_9BACL|nr:protein of unknown function [Kyrpidia spormannii]CAB3392603.1 protein of unknown function [Kyrpidia spormannii]